MTDFGPTIDEENQQEPPRESLGPPVPIVSNYPLRTQELPGVVNSIRTVLLPGDGSIVNIANEDRRRKQITIIPIGQPARLSTNQNFQVGSTESATIPSNQLVILVAITKLYGITGTPGTDCPVTVIETDWSE